MNGINRWCLFIFSCLLYLSFLCARAAGSTWSKVYSGFGAGRSVQQTSDQEGYIATGYVSGQTSADVWVLKVDAAGFIEWQKSFTGIEFDGANYVQQTSNGGYIVVGQSNSYGAGSWEGWVIRLDFPAMWNGKRLLADLRSTPFQTDRSWSSKSCGNDL